MPPMGRDAPDVVLAGVDASAARLGLSRVEYIRRRLASDAATSNSGVCIDDLRACGRAFSDLADEQVMDGAWR